MKSKLVLLALLLAGTTHAATPSIVVSAAGGLSVGGIEVKKEGVDFSKRTDAEKTAAKDANLEKDLNGASAILDGNVALTWAHSNLFYGVNFGYMYNFGKYGKEGLKLTETEFAAHKTGLIAKIAADLEPNKKEAETKKINETKNDHKSYVTSGSHLFYGGPVVGYNFNDKFSAGLGLNYVASAMTLTVSEVEEKTEGEKKSLKDKEGTTKQELSQTFHGFMPTLFASYSFGSGISAKVSVGYAMFFGQDEAKKEEAKAAPAEAKAEEAKGKISDVATVNNLFIATVGVSFKAL